MVLSSVIVRHCDEDDEDEDKAVEQEEEEEEESEREIDSPAEENLCGSDTAEEIGQVCQAAVVPRYGANETILEASVASNLAAEPHEDIRREVGDEAVLREDGAVLLSEC